MARPTAEMNHWARTQEEFRKLLVAMIDRDRLTQAEIAQKCNWYNRQGKPDQARVSSYTTGTKFSMPAYTWMVKRVWNLTLVQFVAAATNEVSTTLEQTEINRIMNDLPKEQNEALVSSAKAMQRVNLQNARLKEQVKHLKEG